MKKHSDNIGSTIKDLRKKKGLTLKELSLSTNFSVGFLSQLERGMTSIAIDSLEILAHSLDVELSYFFKTVTNEKKNSLIVRSYNRDTIAITDKIIQHNLSSDITKFEIYPRLIDIMPFSNNGNNELQLYSHEGEEFIFILEGILTLVVDEEEYELYPGDSATFNSSTLHNWKNTTNNVTRLICVHNPNPFKEN